MIRRFRVFIFFLLCFSQEAHSQKITNDPPSVSLSANYTDAKQKALFVRDSLQNIKNNTRGEKFTELLLHHIIPHWYGTPWSFEGHTSVPQKGEIACGYFVSTTLKHVGLNINRYKLAQQWPINEAKSLAQSDTVLTIEKNTTEEIIQEIKFQTCDGLYFLGFDQSHVGYLYNTNGDLFIIHSNYLSDKGVEIEPVSESDVFSSYFKYHIVPLSTNKEFLDSWITQKEFVVVTK